MGLFCMSAKRTVFILNLGWSSVVSCKLRVKVMSNVTENITVCPTNLTVAHAEAVNEMQIDALHLQTLSATPG